MKSFALINAALVLPGLASAAICNNNCGRAVAGTNRRDPPYASRLSLCQEFVTTYDIPPVPLPSPIGVRNVHAPRQVSEPIITGTKPAYATSCPDVTAYWSACQCFSGVVATTITSIPEPTISTSVSTAEPESSSASESTTTEEPETTLTTIVTLSPVSPSVSETSSASESSIEPESSSASESTTEPETSSASESATASESESVSETATTTEASSASETSTAPETTSTSESASESESATSSEPASSTTSSATSSSTPSCTSGVEYARYFYTQGSPLCEYLGNNTTPPREYDLNSLLQGRVPNITGVTTQVGFNVVNNPNPVTIYGVEGPAGTTAQCQIVDHRGYLKPSTIGIYTITATEPDDIILFWIGSNANSGSFRSSNSDIYAQHNQPTRSSGNYTLLVTDASEYIPFRLLWTNGRLSGKFTVEIKNSTGDVILGRTTTANPSIIASCDGEDSPVPAWLDWEAETVPDNGN